MSTETPMFPLGSVLLPSMLLPLHIFEDRYRLMIEHVLAGDGTFGVTMIERGSEVGGHDVRAAVGCTARVLDAEQQPDGRWHLVAVGTERISVDEWLPDAPFPRAMVSPLPDTLTTVTAWDELVTSFRTLIELVERVTGSTDLAPGVPMADDPAMATFEMAAVAPIGPLDRYRVLSSTDVDARRLLLLDAFEHATVLVNDAASN